MSKYRVKQVNKQYYPQFKLFGLFWMTFECVRAEGSYKYSFSELGAAMEFIRGFDSEDKKKIVTIHKYTGERS